MAQKTNPETFRLPLGQEYNCKWFSTKNYKTFAKKDYYIRNLIETNFFDLLDLSRVKIARSCAKNNDQMHILCEVLQPTEDDISTKILKSLAKYISLRKLKKIDTIYQSECNYNYELFSKTLKLLFFYLASKSIFSLKENIENSFKIYTKFNLSFLKSRYESAMLVAKLTAFFLAKRFSSRRVIEDILTNVDKDIVKGLKIELSGRLDNIEKARTESKLFGRVPLHTLTTTVQYSHYILKTISGILGIKVWLYLG
jgi:small subunit ribosomal protein S3